MMAFAPTENHVAVAEAPPTIDATLKAAYDCAAIYFPFTDVIVADPYQDVADGLKLAFYIGQSRVVGGTTTDMVAYANGDVFVQIWIGAEDKLPRMGRAVYRNDPSQLRHQMDLSNWQLDLAVPAEAFASANASKARRIQFARRRKRIRHHHLSSSTGVCTAGHYGSGDALLSVAPSVSSPAAFRGGEMEPERAGLPTLPADWTSRDAHGGLEA